MIKERDLNLEGQFVTEINNFIASTYPIAETKEQAKMITAQDKLSFEKLWDRVEMSHERYYLYISVLGLLTRGFEKNHPAILDTSTYISNFKTGEIKTRKDCPVTANRILAVLQKMEEDPDYDIKPSLDLALKKIDILIFSEENNSDEDGRIIDPVRFEKVKAFKKDFGRRQKGFWQKIITRIAGLTRYPENFRGLSGDN